MKTAMPADMRKVIVRHLGQALAEAWRRQQVDGHERFDRDDGEHKKGQEGADDAALARL